MNTYTLTAEQLQTILAAILDTTVDADDSREQGQLNPTITAASYRKLKSAHALLLQITLTQTDHAEQEDYDWRNPQHNPYLSPSK